MKKLALIVVLSGISVLACAGDKDTEDLLAKMRKAYKEVKTASFKLESTLQADDGDIVVNMSGGFKSPKNMYVDISFQEAKLKIVTNGERIYALNNFSDEVADIPYSDDIFGRALQWTNLEVICFYEWQKQLSTTKGDNMATSKLSIRQNEEWNDKKWIVLEESAPDVGVYVEYYINPKTHLIWRTVVMTIDKEFIRGDYILKELKTGVKIDDKMFKKPVITN